MIKKKGSLIMNRLAKMEILSLMSRVIEQAKTVRALASREIASGKDGIEIDDEINDIVGTYDIGQHFKLEFRDGRVIEFDYLDFIYNPHLECLENITEVVSMEYTDNKCNVIKA